MTPSGDYVHEMPTLHEIDDDTAEAILTGRSVPPELAGFMQALRKSASRPVAPSAELAARMVTGNFTKAGGAHRTSAHRPQGRGTGTAARAWVRTGVRVLAAVPRTYSAARRGVKAVVATAAVAVPVVGLSGIGFAGALPDPVQERFEGVVESVTPYEFPAQDGGSSGFGEHVSEDAKDGGVDGPEVSEEARNRDEKQNPADREQGVPATPGPPDDLPADPPGPPDDLPVDPPGPGDLPQPSAPAHGRS